MKQTPSNGKPSFKTNGASKAIMFFKRQTQGAKHKIYDYLTWPERPHAIGRGVTPTRKPLKIVYFMDESIDKTAI